MDACFESDELKCITTTELCLKGAVKQTARWQNYKRETEINPDFDLGWVNFARAAKYQSIRKCKVALETVTQRNLNLVEAQVRTYGLYVKLEQAKRASILL